MMERKEKKKKKSAFKKIKKGVRQFFRGTCLFDIVVALAVMTIVTSALSYVGYVVVSSWSCASDCSEAGLLFKETDYGQCVGYSHDSNGNEILTIVKGSEEGR